MEPNYKYYEEQTFERYKNASLQELEYAYDQISLHGSNGRGQTASVPLIKLYVIQKLIKERKKNGL
jgi:hypothetical protein